MHALLVLFELLGRAADGRCNGGRRRVGGYSADILPVNLERGTEVKHAVASKAPAFAAQNSALPTILIPAGFVIERTTTGTQDRNDRIAVNMLFHSPGTNGAMQAQSIGFDDVILSNGDGLFFSFAHESKGPTDVLITCGRHISLTLILSHLKGHKVNVARDSHGSPT